MLSDFISITGLQRNLKSVFGSVKKPFQIVLSNNNLTGIVISKQAAQYLLDSGILDQLREELWEINDSETADLVRESRIGKGKHSIAFDDFVKEVA